MYDISKQNLSNEFADSEKTALTFLNDEADRLEESVKTFKPIVERAELESERLEMANRSIVITLNGTTLKLDGAECEEYTLTDLVEMAKNKQTENKLRRYLFNKYSGMKLTLSAFCKETLLSEQQAKNAYVSLDLPPIAQNAMRWYPIDDVVLILMMLKED